ncbi:MAG: ComF family protein [Bacteroidetes bacterium]|nr:ComF family protein [Bacteroidota bacterium]HET6243273.1 phosphoribosyltransferase family protein [Bacteroidia bacterium]
MLRDFISLIYPDCCLSCGQTLLKQEHHICTVCRYKLPKTGFHFEKENILSQVFWGRIDLHSVAAYYYFQKGGGVQHLLHAIKYLGATQAAKEVGKMYGAELKASPYFKSVNIVIPIPLHPTKKKKRGFNQSDFIAEGIAEGLNSNWSPDILTRDIAGESQTKKSRFNRWKNVEAAFNLKDINAIAGKHVLIVDDVITTGATIESSAKCMACFPDTKISVAAIAYAQN